MDSSSVGGAGFVSVESKAASGKERKVEEEDEEGQPSIRELKLGSWQWIQGRSIQSIGTVVSQVCQSNHLLSPAVPLQRRQESLKAEKHSFFVVPSVLVTIHLLAGRARAGSSEKAEDKD